MGDSATCGLYRGEVKTEMRLEFDHFPVLANSISAKADAVCGRIAMAIWARAAELMANSPATGRIYALGERTVSFVTKAGQAVSFVAYRGQAPRQHQASAPGEPPAVDTGNLINSGYAMQKRLGLWEVGFTAEYAAPLEYGTARIAPRPFLRPALEAYRQMFYDALRAVLGR